MTSIYHSQYNSCVRDWLIRVYVQYDEAMPRLVKTVDYNRTKEKLAKITDCYHFCLPQSGYSRYNVGNTTTTYNTYNVVDHACTIPVDSSASSKEDLKKTQAEKEKTNWAGIAVISTISTVVLGIALFVYVRLYQAEKGSRNDLENTIKLKNWSEIRKDLSPNINDIYSIASEVQEKIDQRAVNKIVNYKYSVLTGLVGTLTMAIGGIVIFTAAPLFAVYGVAAVVAGVALNLFAGGCAIINCGTHWDDKEEGKKQLDSMKRKISFLNLIHSFSPNSQPSSFYGSNRSSQQSFKPTAPPFPSNEETFQAIYNQRHNPKDIYPDLSQFDPYAKNYS